MYIIYTYIQSDSPNSFYLNPLGRHNFIFGLLSLMMTLIFSLQIT